MIKQITIKQIPYNFGKESEDFLLETKDKTKFVEIFVIKLEEKYGRLRISEKIEATILNEIITFFRFLRDKERLEDIEKIFVNMGFEFPIANVYNHFLKEDLEALFKIFEIVIREFCGKMSPTLASIIIKQLIENRTLLRTYNL